ncbi:MAG: 4'-phosphopantetheinyl transferase superfamily protein [Acidimicrobiia bacterium]|nr:4'-phosphopantetheinyl transferase superfamily protein [Acidimicrobiia bacterium]
MKALFDIPVAAFELAGPGDESTLAPPEAAAVAAAGPRRRGEFAAGRQCAHAALASWGMAPAPLLARHDRAPAWPAGVFGSITHTENYALAVVARPLDAGRRAGGGAEEDRVGTAVGVGVDAERTGRLSPDLYPVVFTAAERSWLGRTTAARRAEAATAAFSAKEAFYKAQHPWTGSWVGFADVEARPASGALELVPASSLSVLHHWSWPVAVRWTASADLVLVGVTVHRARRSPRTRRG